LETIIGHLFFTHDPAKIPKSLPSCCTHVAPDWQEDRDGFLVPVVAEADERKYRSSKNATSKTPNTAKTQQVPLRESRQNVHNQEALSRGKENEASQKPTSQFEIYNENASQRPASSRSEQLKSITSSSRVKSADRGMRQTSDVDFTAQKSHQDGTTDDIIDKFSACAIQDSANEVESPREPQCKGGNDADANALESMYSRLKELGAQVEANGGPTMFKPASPIQVLGADKWVTCYVDYTSKYGLGFLFNDGR
jgi:hypothetical protein